MSLEFEIPLVSFIFILILNFEYFRKEKVSLLENKPFSFIMIFSLILSFLDTVLHFISALNSSDTIMNYYSFITISNRVLSTMFVSIFSALFCYTLLITYNWARKKYRKIVNSLIIVNFLFAIAVSFMGVEIVEIGNVRNTTGPALMFGYVMVAVFLILSIIVCILNVKKHEKRHIAIFLILLMVLTLYVATLIFPGIILYDLILALMCYIMYFTLENPDLQMMREFHKQRELAEESNNEKISFLFNLSNDIKAPIMNIGRVSNEALNEEDTNLVKEDLRQIRSTSNELLQLVDNVLDVSDLEKRKIGIRGREYNVYNLFNVLNKLFEKTLDKNIEYRFNYDYSIPEYLYGDSIRLKQIMNILLDNAREYTKEGFVEVNVNHIVKHDVCRLIITVEDSGEGIHSEELKHIFDKEKIYSDESLKTIDDAKNNLGMLKSLVSLMNGSVMVNSEYGKGSKFTIVVDQKMKIKKTKVIEAVEKYEELYENKEKVLLVTDEEDIQKEIKKLLKKYDVELEIVEGGQNCLEKIRENKKYDMILIEEDLPKLSSGDTLFKLGELGVYKTPIIVLTLRKEFGVEEELIKKGFNDVIKLPLKKDETIKTIDKYLEK